MNKVEEFIWSNQNPNWNNNINITGEKNRVNFGVNNLDGWININKLDTEKVLDSWIWKTQWQIENIIKKLNLKEKLKEKKIK